MNAPVIIEFVGLSGAGKSTVAEELTETLRQQGKRCATRQMIGGRELPRPEHYRRLVQFLFTHPWVLTGSARLGLPAMRHGTSRLREALRFHVWSYRLAVGRKMECDIVILDQGVIQEGWGLMVRQTGWNHDAVAAAALDVIARVKATYALVYFEVDRGVAAQRIATRDLGESRFDGMRQSEASQLLALHEPTLRSLYDGAVRQLILPSLRVDAGKPVAELVSQISAFIDQFSSGSGRR
jgi:thymidylate kinase